MEKWEYKILCENDYYKPGTETQVEQMTSKLNELGEAGWELVSFGWINSVLKRKKNGSTNQ